MQQPGAQVQCVDGYFRDASGMCVPGAAPPGAAAPPDSGFVAIAPTFVGPSTGPTITPGPATTMAPQQRTMLGIGLKWWVVGAAGLGIAAIAYGSSGKTVTANKRRRKKA